jgi:transposase
LRLRLGHGLPQRVLAQSLGRSQSSISGYLSRARRAGASWPLPEALDDEGQLEALLFPPAPDVPTINVVCRTWAMVHRELRRPNVTLALLWEEYRAVAADGFGYSCYVAAVLRLRASE